jgi:hypothetical protein
MLQSAWHAACWLGGRNEHPKWQTSHSTLDGVTPFRAGELPIPRMTGTMSRVFVTTIFADGLMIVS